MERNLPQRKQIRLIGFNYAQSGFYFVTVCTKNRECIFGDIVGVGRDRPVDFGRDRPATINNRPKMVLNNYGKIVTNVWNSLPDHHPVILAEFQIMPNHVHFILQMGASHQGSSRRTHQGESRLAPTEYKPTLGFVVGAFKSEITKQINRLTKTPGAAIFQRNYYERIIRTDSELNKIREYIQSNPAMWDRDRNNPKN